MSRSAKSRAEKGRGGGSAVVPVPPASLQPPAPTSDIVPGRLTETSWREMLQQDEGEEVVSDLMDGLLEQVLDRCYQVQLQRQLVPFSIHWAHDALVRVIKWRFLMRDEGENSDSAPLWTEDAEPEPSVTDSWAEGCVPAVYINQQTPFLQKLLELSVKDAEDSSNPDSSGKSHSQDRNKARTKTKLRNIKATEAHKEMPTLPTFSGKSNK
ncbi:uncharacterized protein C2orf81 homolog [Hoplias malabaricus]|uniref:uncharacterized protein C2orf81 homolog n=1 Tax=Hoplias malabaricus TaxID=27720 RepID=UPI0034625097